MIAFTDALVHEDYRRIPDYILKGIYSYVGHRLRSGDFLLAVFRNDLSEAVGRADKETLAALKEIVIFGHMEVPSICHGSPAAVNNWLNPPENPCAEQPIVTRLEAFQQLVNVHETAFHAHGEPHKGCGPCESLRAPNEECREWVMGQPVGIELKNIPYTQHYVQTKNPLDRFKFVDEKHP